MNLISNDLFQWNIIFLYLYILIHTSVCLQSKLSFGSMDSRMTCKSCGQMPRTQCIRCNGYKRSSSDENTRSPSFSRTSLNLSFELHKKKIGSKLMRKRSSGGSRSPTSLVVPTDTPGGGKRAFLCGVTYKKQKFELKGTAQDVKNMKDLLVSQFGFKNESILVLAENESCIAPTKKNIEDAFQWLVRGIQKGDSLVFYFSGHGLRQRDFVGDEIDGFDETICPVDYKTNGIILDNYINKEIVGPLISGVTLHAIVDCCHSGTILDLPHVYNIIDNKWDNNRPPSGAFKGTRGGKAISFSACEDYQQAADTSTYSPEKEMNGAMTCTFIKAIKEATNSGKNTTYRKIMDSMHNSLKEAQQKSGCLTSGIMQRVFYRRILQDPILSSSEEFDIDTEFEL